MVKRFPWPVLVFLAAASPAHALCIYDGKLYAKTTLAEEFRDSTLVVKATRISHREIFRSAKKYDDDFGDMYGIRVDQVFKSNAKGIILDYTERDSGGFYLGEDGEGPPYLLFLDPIRSHYWAGRIVPGAFEVNYSCGQSRPWNKVSAADQRQLAALANPAK